MRLQGTLTTTGNFILGIADSRGDGRPDFRYRVAFDRQTGMLLAVDEYRGARLTRSAAATAVELDMPIPASAFAVELPADAVSIY